MIRSFHVEEFLKGCVKLHASQYVLMKNEYLVVLLVYLLA